ncbi:hypothetical protein EG68_07853 [Paragonimus skrjabini miyazakii]|uniref:Uncharacterized protein n=1 Tax=Paragonimus skrjabini miyazakii TaxID=59628 RepID=A0A8S9Y9J8_9TREM|nr:hypothetical protein EG68_07853 [Paragonimus skrjabini miyazakii]
MSDRPSNASFLCGDGSLSQISFNKPASAGRNPRFTGNSDFLRLTVDSRTEENKSACLFHSLALSNASKYSIPDTYSSNTSIAVISDGSFAHSNKSSMSRVSSQSYQLEKNRLHCSNSMPIHSNENHMHRVGYNPCNQLAGIAGCNKDFSLRVITLQIRRLRGISAQMRRFTDFPFLIEIYGYCPSFVKFANVPGFQFVLQDVNQLSSKQNCNGDTVVCVFYDFDEVGIIVSPGSTYRCVGRYHSDERVFQCFNIEQCDEQVMQLMETFKFHSNLEIAQIIQKRNISEELPANKRRVRKIAFKGLVDESNSTYWKETRIVGNRVN